MSNTTNKYAPEVRDRAVRKVRRQTRLEGFDTAR